MEEIDQNAEASADESGVIKALRIQLKEQEKELKARPAREDLESEIRTQLKRESDIAALLTKQGQPSGLAEFALSKIGDQEVTEESVAGFLKGLGYDTQPVSSDGQESAPPNQQLAEVTDLASRVSAAASNAPAGNVEDRLAKATSLADIETIMAEIGALQS
jgi:hypothetical protein